jgi:hypothetical protein
LPPNPSTSSVKSFVTGTKFGKIIIKCR